MKILSKIILCVGVGSAGSMATAQAVVASVAAGSGTVLECVQDLDGKWMIAFEQGTGARATFEVLGTSTADNEHIKYIRVYNDRNDVTPRLYVGESANIQRLGSVDEIRGFEDGEADVLAQYAIRELFINGTLGNNADSDNGRVWCRNFRTGVVNGDLENELRVPKGQELSFLDIGGSLLGSINGPDYIVEAILIGGDLGRVGYPDDGIRVDTYIKHLEVGGDVNGLITTLVYEPYGSTPGPIGRLGVGGDFNGVLETVSDDFAPPSGLPGGIFIGGDLTGSLTLREGITKKLHVDGSFASGAVINLPEDGVQGQITFNRGASTGTWAGQIIRDLDDDGDWVIGGGSADAELVEEYTKLPSVIGGGAVGKAPFNAIHDETADPSSPGYVFITEIDIFDPMMGCEDLDDFDDPITFEMYGPVSLVSGTGPHAQVDKWNGSAWVDAGFDVTTTIDSGTASRGLRFVRSDQNERPRDFVQYRITPTSGRIVSTDVLGTPTADFEYFLEILDGCTLSLLSTYDLNQDDTLCSQDIAEWAASPVDFNGDSAADGDDATLLLRAVDVFND